MKQSALKRLYESVATFVGDMLCKIGLHDWERQIWKTGGHCKEAFRCKRCGLTVF